MNDELPGRLFLFVFFFCIFLAFLKGTFPDGPGCFSY